MPTITATHAPRRGTPRKAPPAKTSPKVGLLASDIEDLVTVSGSATRDDLMRIGWTQELLDLHLPAARKLVGERRRARKAAHA